MGRSTRKKSKGISMLDEPDEDVDAAVEDAMASLSTLTPEQIVAFFDELTSEYCRHCGMMMSGERCYCEDDE